MAEVIGDISEKNDLNNCSVIEEGKLFIAQLLLRGTKSGKKLIVGVRISFIWSVVISVQCRGSGKQKIFRQRYLFIFPISLESK